MKGDCIRSRNVLHLSKYGTSIHPLLSKIYENLVSPQYFCKGHWEFPLLSIFNMEFTDSKFLKLPNLFWVNDQPDAQLRYIKRLLLQSSTCITQHCAHHQVELY